MWGKEMIHTISQQMPDEIDALIAEGYVPFAATQDSQGVYWYSFWFVPFGSNVEFDNEMELNDDNSDLSP